METLAEREGGNKIPEGGAVYAKPREGDSRIGIRGRETDVRGRRNKDLAGAADKGRRRESDPRDRRRRVDENTRTLHHFSIPHPIPPKPSQEMQPFTSHRTGPN